MELGGNILVIVSDFMHEQTCNYVAAIEQKANSLGYGTTVFSMLQLSELFTNGEEFVYELIDFNSYAGVVFIAKSFSVHKGLLTNIEKFIKDKCNKPIVSIGQTSVTELSLGEPSDEAFELISDHMIEKHACKTIYFLGGNKDNNTTLRISGVKKSYEKHGMSFSKSWVLYGGYWKEGAEKLARDLSYGKLQMPDAIMCISDEIAFFLIENLFKVGIKVPEDVLVTGYRRTAYSRNNIIPITTASADEEYTGFRAVTTLHELITGESVLEGKVSKPTIYTGLSCGCGVSNQGDVRLRLEQYGIENTKKMEYRNSFIKEKIFLLRDKAELVNRIKNLIYLVPNNSSVGIYTFEEEDSVECLFLSEVVESENSLQVKKPSLFPENMLSENENNVHVFPLIFNGEKLGYMTIGYSDAVYSYKQAIDFAEMVSIALKLFKERKMYGLAADEEFSLDKAKNQAIEKKTYILGEKDDIVSKINIENIYYFEGIDKEVFAITKNNRYNVDQRLYEYEEKFKKQHFIRVSKSMLLNMSKVVAFKENSDRSITATLNSRETVRISRKYKEIFKDNIID